MFNVTTLPTPTTRRGLLERLVFHGIVFNMSWEDPEMDRQAFRLTSDDTVISITSAGCNPLNFLCQNPRRLICVDGNPAQNAVLELKMAAIASLDHATFFDIFAAQRPSVVSKVYRPRLRPLLSQASRDFWDKNLWMAHRGLYDFGRMGIAARIVRGIFPIIGISKRRMASLFHARSLEEQQAIYRRHVAPRLWGPVVERLCKSNWFMFLCGVHPNQLDLVDTRHGIYDYIKERIEYALTKVPTADNYFLTVTATGKFNGTHVPPYLLEKNYEALRDNLDKVEIVNGWLGPYLDAQPEGSIDKFNLLDIFDWMPAEMFESTLKSAIRAASDGATIIYRSGSYQLEPPKPVQPLMTPRKTLADKLLATDRSATYGSFYIFTIDKTSAGETEVKPSIAAGAAC